MEKDVIVASTGLGTGAWGLPVAEVKAQQQLFIDDVISEIFKEVPLPRIAVFREFRKEEKEPASFGRDKLRSGGFIESTGRDSRRVELEIGGDVRPTSSREEAKSMPVIMLYAWDSNSYPGG